MAQVKRCEADIWSKGRARRGGRDMLRRQGGANPERIARGGGLIFHFPVLYRGIRGRPLGPRSRGRPAPLATDGSGKPEEEKHCAH